LEAKGFLRRIPQINERGQTSNRYVFLWHPIFDAWAKLEGVKPTTPEGVQSPSGEGVQASAPTGVKDTAPKESPSQENHSQEGHVEDIQRDIDCATTNCKNRNSQPRASVCKSYPNLREMMACYFMETGQEKIYPSDRQVVDVLDAARSAYPGVEERDVMLCLKHLYEDRGLRPGTRHGPRHWAWFPTVVGDYFSKQSAREESANPCGYDEWEDRNLQREVNRASDEGADLDDDDLGIPF
jgi:hypothetical protein